MKEAFRTLVKVKHLSMLLPLALALFHSWLLYHILHQQGRFLLRMESLEDKQEAYELRAFGPGEASAGLTQVPSVAAPDRSQPHSSEQFDDGEEIELTIGMATYNDFNGVYFTLQALRLYQDLSHTELLVIDNYGCDATKSLVENRLSARYMRATNVVGTAAPRDMVFREARGRAVLCCDCHVLFAPGALARLKQYYRDHPDCRDLLQGPLTSDDIKNFSTHFDPVWRAQMWGTWGRDERGRDENGEPFEIPMQGLGVFSCLKAAWPGFHPQFRGFGGEEGYIHEKFRQAGGRCLCLPFLRWMHRFTRVAGPPYPLSVEGKLRNYLLGHSELGLTIKPIIEHFSEYLPAEKVRVLTEQTLGKQWVESASEQAAVHAD
jgi:hypothetical protein